MLLQRYGLYVIAFGLALILVAVGLLITRGFGLLLLLLGFYGVITALVGLWMWEAGKRSL